MTTRRVLRWALLPLLLVGATAALAGPPTATPLPAAQAAAPAAALQSQDANFPGVVADLTECRRKDGVLSVKVRLRNTSAQNVDAPLIKNRNYDDFYVMASSKKYFMLRDSERNPIGSQADGFGSLTVTIQKGGGYTWWAKYPAPPDSEAKVTIVTPFAAPFEDVPISQ